MRKKSQDNAVTTANIIWFFLILWGLFSFFNWLEKEKTKEQVSHQQESRQEAAVNLSSNSPRSGSFDSDNGYDPDPPRDYPDDAEADFREMQATDEAEYIKSSNAEILLQEKQQATAFAELYSDTCPHTKSGSNLRAGPGTSYTVIGFAPQDSCIPIDGKNNAGTWYTFHDEEEFGPGVTVWIWAELINDAPDSLPVVSASVTPIPQAAPNKDDYQDYLDTVAAEAAIEAQAEREWWQSEKATLQADGILEPGCAGGCTSFPDWCAPPIKGNVSYNTGEKIYHVPGQSYYDETVINPAYGERWFCTEDEAKAACWRKAR